MAQLIEKLASTHHIALLFLRAADDPPIDEILKERCKIVEEIIRPGIGHTITQQWSRRIRLLISLLRGKPLWVTKWAVPAYRERVRVIAQMWQPDLVQIEHHIMGQYLSALDDCGAPRVLIAHEPRAKAAYEQYQSQQGFARWIQYLDMLAWKKFDQEIITKVQTVVVFTEHDRQTLAPLTLSTPIVRIPFGTMIPDHPLNSQGYPPVSLLFVGNFSHPPNVDAALRLITRIFPYVQARFPELILYIVGDQPPSQIQQMANEHIIITGRVPDVTPYLDRAALVVVPLRLGGGMRVKVVEALAAGKAVIASPRAIAGLDVVDGEHIILAESDEQFCRAILELLGDPEKRSTLATQARIWAYAHLNWDNAVKAYETLYESLLSARSARIVVE